ncbi:hypothetical protein LJR074_003507 [Acidovorax sp. LjRoot74]|uniref:hypothetical protein n=1 Tax=Acidovorax sp. LjRoot74 TaxID=3342337 RepID=UPI003ECFABCD
MTTVEAPIRKAAATANPVPSTNVEAPPEWERLAKAVALDLAEATERTKALADLAVNELTPVATLLDEAHVLLGQITCSVNAKPLNSAVTDEAYTALFKPMAFVQGAAAITAAGNANVLLLPSLRSLHTSLDEIQNNLGDQVLGAMLPNSTATAPDATPQNDAIQVAFGQIEYLLNHAQGTEEDHSWSGDSERLIRIAHGLADEAALRPPKGVEIDQVAYDIAALIRASRLVPGDTESKERTAILTQVEQHLRSITECLEDCCDPGAPRPPAPGEAAEESAQKAEMRECARTACYEIQCLAEAMQTVAEKFGSSEDQPVAHGIMARIIVLSEIVYHAAQLHGEAPMATLAELRNSFKGRL